MNQRVDTSLNTMGQSAANHVCLHKLTFVFEGVSRVVKLSSVADGLRNSCELEDYESISSVSLFVLHKLISMPLFLGSRAVGSAALLPLVSLVV